MIGTHQQYIESTTKGPIVSYSSTTYDLSNPITKEEQKVIFFKCLPMWIMVGWLIQGSLLVLFSCDDLCIMIMSDDDDDDDGV